MYGNVTLYQKGADGDSFVKCGMIDFWTKESTIKRQSEMANL